MKKTHRLVLIPDYQHHSGEEFREIQALIGERAKDVEVVLTDRKKLSLRYAFMLRKPTLFVSWIPLGRWSPRWGTLSQGKALQKSEQLTLIAEAGIETGRFQPIGPGVTLDPSLWGPVVVLKPEGGARGKMVRIWKTSRVSWDRLAKEEERYLAQEFIYTGPQPVSYRVQTLFGKSIYAHKTTNKACGNVLESPEQSASFQGHNIVASSRGAQIEPSFDSEVTAFAERIAGEVFPEIPSLGIDVMREFGTGRLVVAEVNPWGQTWHVSSRLGRQLQEANHFTYLEEFNLVENVADILIQATRERAS